jgi:hypothetical protein
MLLGGGCLLKAKSPNKAHGNLAESMPATTCGAGISAAGRCASLRCSNAHHDDAKAGASTHQFGA